MYQESRNPLLKGGNNRTEAFGSNRRRSSVEDPPEEKTSDLNLKIKSRPEVSGRDLNSTMTLMLVECR